mgnify:FL=1
MLRPSQLADPRIFQNETVEYEVKWSKDSTVVTLSLIVDGTRHRMKFTAAELDLLREFLNANIE